MADMSPIDLQKALKGADYPASRDDLVSLARDNGADDKVVDKLSQSGRQQFDGPNAVQKAVFGNDWSSTVNPIEGRVGMSGNARFRPVPARAR
ncbi:hypothetical protein QFZ32_009148 [Streptomyces canus]|uniref:DUF2795 domain-containing protein n=1 Tax=Streptomyces canus TaxID=58343 RepID=A0AAW8FUH4_9ACTN|nr:hypothetical protein [Streptomyces canus]MDQ1073620.1 hypothetical protein [Streptomyces canus]